MSMVLLFTLNIKSFLVVLVEPGCLRILLYFGSLFFFFGFPMPCFLGCLPLLFCEYFGCMALCVPSVGDVRKWLLVAEGSSGNYPRTRSVCPYLQTLVSSPSPRPCKSCLLPPELPSSASEPLSPW